MATQTVNFCTTNAVPSCQCLYPRPVVFCVPEVLTASGQPFLTGTLTNVQKAGNACSCVYKYTIEYDDADLVDPTTPLTPAEVSGIFCTDCFTTWIEAQGGDSFCLEVEDTDTVNLTVVEGETCDTLSADVNISVDDGNIIEARADGLYASGSEASDAWLLVGNSGTVEGTNFLGTIDNIDFQIRQNNQQVGLFTKRNATNYDGHDVIFGGQQNNISAGSRGSGNTISGGGPTGFANLINDSGTAGSYNASCVISGGEENLISEAVGDFSWANVIGGGVENLIVDQNYSTIGGGLANRIEASGAANETGSANTIAGGLANEIIDNAFGELCGFIGGGQGNWLYRSENGSIVGGNQNNNFDSDYAVILGGFENVTDTATFASILGGAKLTLGAYSVGYQSPASFNIFAALNRDLSAFPEIAYWGDVDVWVANTDGTARKLKLFEANADITFATPFYTSFEAQTQAANIEYVMPAAAGIVTDVLTIAGIAGDIVTLEWAAGGAAALTGWSTDGSGHFIQNAVTGSDIIFNAADGVIRQGTSDGSDSKDTIIAGGGGTTSARGSFAAFFGNENGTGLGRIWYVTGAGSGAGADHQFYTNPAGTDLLRWSITAAGAISQDATNGGDLVFNVATGLIRQGTSDTADTKLVSIAGGGSNSPTRGGFIELYGNEHGGLGGIAYATGRGSGAGSAHAFYTDVGAGALLRWSFSANGTLTQDATNGGDLVFNAATGLIRQGTTDGSDSNKITVAGGGADSTSRGAYIQAHGNEHAELGAIRYLTGRGSGSGSDHKFYTDQGAGGLLRWSFSAAGTLVQDAANGSDIVFTKATTAIQLQSGANGRTGTFSLNGSTPVTVNNTSLAAGDQIIITRDTPAGTPGDWHLTARVNGTSFEVTGTASDTSGMRYTLIRIN